MTIYGSLQGPPIPDSVDRENLPLGRQHLKLVKVVKEGKSRNGQSVNITYLVASAVKGVRGTAFFRYNFRHTGFHLGNQAFPSYFDPSFPTDGLKRLEALANGETQAAEPARKELTRARIALSTLKRLNVLAGLGPAHGLDSQRLVGTEFEGTVEYRDRAGIRVRLGKEGNEVVDKKGNPVPAKMFDETTANAEVTAIFAAPKETEAEAPAALDPEEEPEPITEA